MTLFDNILNFFSETGRYLQQQTTPLINTYNVPRPNTNDPYTLNRWLNDLREQTPQYQAQKLEQLKQQQTVNMLMAAAGGIVLGAIFFK